MHINDFPPETLSGVLQHIDTSAVLACGEVCSRWRCVAQTQHNYIRSLSVKRDDAKFATNIRNAQRALLAFAEDNVRVCLRVDIGHETTLTDWFKQLILHSVQRNPAIFAELTFSIRPVHLDFISASLSFSKMRRLRFAGLFALESNAIINIPSDLINLPLVKTHLSGRWIDLRLSGVVSNVRFLDLYRPAYDELDSIPIVFPVLSHLRLVGHFQYSRGGRDWVRSPFSNQSLEKVSIEFHDDDDEQLVISHLSHELQNAPSASLAIEFPCCPYIDHIWPPSTAPGLLHIRAIGVSPRRFSVTYSGAYYRSIAFSQSEIFWSDSLRRVPENLVELRLGTLCLPWLLSAKGHLPWLKSFEMILDSKLSISILFNLSAGNNVLRCPNLSFLALSAEYPATTITHDCVITLAMHIRRPASCRLELRGVSLENATSETTLQSLIEQVWMLDNTDAM